MQVEFATLNFDTHRVFRLLGEKGFTEEQAEGVLLAIQQVQMVGVATKQDIREVKKEIAELRVELKQDITDLRTELKQDISDVRGEVKNLRSEIYRVLMIQTATIIGVTSGLTATLIKFMS